MTKHPKPVRIEALSELFELPDMELADVICRCCEEMQGRADRLAEYQLEVALKVWPDLHAALRVKGKEVGLNDNAEPRLTDWSDVPVVPLSGYYGGKPKTKREALEIVKRYGHSHWATMGELWLWLVDAGPIIEKGMKEFGYTFI